MLEGQLQGEAAGEVELCAGRVPARGLPAGCPCAAPRLVAYPQPGHRAGHGGLCKADILHACPRVVVWA